jgi:hypothetical protein
MPARPAYASAHMNLAGDTVPPAPCSRFPDVHMGITRHPWSARWYHASMTDDLSRQAATSPDEYTLTIDDALPRYEHAGHPRTARSIQRYCANGHLDCLRQETPFGEKYLVTPASVARHIAQIEELANTTRRDLPRPVAPDVAKDQSQKESSQEPTTSPDTSRPVAAYIERVEDENEFLRKQIDVKDGQLAVKDKTIEALLERDRETNILVNQLQKMLAPMLPQSIEPRSESTDRTQ